MTTFRQLVDELDSRLHSFTADVEQRCAIGDPIAASGDATFSVDNAAALSSGIIEIDQELLYVLSVNVQSALITVPAWGRGQGGTTATAHAAGSVAINSPAFPQVRLRGALNQVLDDCYPSIFNPKAVSLTAIAARVTYQLPADADDILEVSWQDLGPSKAWIPIRRWWLDRNADTDAFTTGHSLSIGDPVIAGRRIRVVYAAPFGALDDDGADVTSTGLAPGNTSLLVNGALANLLPDLEPARLQLASVESSARSSQVQPGQATQVAKFYLALYQEKLADEQMRLQRLYSTRVNLGGF